MVAAGWIGYKAVVELQKYLMDSGATVFAHERMISLLRGIVDANGYVGSLPGVDLFQTDGHPTSGGDDVQLVFDPDLALAQMADKMVSTRMVWNPTGFFEEISAWLFQDVVEWNDEAGCKLASDSA